MMCLNLMDCYKYPGLFTCDTWVALATVVSLFIGSAWLAKCWCQRAALLRIINKRLMTWPLPTLWVNHAWKSPAKSGTSSAQFIFVPFPPLTFTQPRANLPPVPISVVMLQTPLYWLVHKLTSIPQCPKACKDVSTRVQSHAEAVIVNLSKWEAIIKQLQYVMYIIWKNFLNYV